MVRRANLVFGATVLISAGLIYYIHHSQQQEIVELKKGVERDLERREFKRKQRMQKVSSDE